MRRPPRRRPAWRIPRRRRPKIVEPVAPPAAEDTGAAVDPEAAEAAEAAYVGASAEASDDRIPTPTPAVTDTTVESDGVEGRQGDDDGR